MIGLIRQKVECPNSYKAHGFITMGLFFFESLDNIVRLCQSV